MEIQQQTMEEIIRSHTDTIWRIALNYTRNAADADDVTQNALLRCLQTDKTFESGEHLRNWVIRVAVNESKRWLASPWHRLMAAACQIDTTPLEAAQSGPRERALYQALLQLPEKYRLVLYLYYYEDRTAAEIAQALGISVSGVTSRLARGRARLKKALKGELDDV